MNFVAVSRNTANISSVPAPVGGLNVYDSLVAMPVTDAIALENLVPQPYGCVVRKGYAAHATGLGAGSVTSLAAWSDTDGATAAFGWSSTDFYDITSVGAVGAPLITGLSNAWWQTTMMANSAGVHMLSFNGADDPIWYSGAGLQRLTAAVGPGQWTGVNPATLIQATVHQGRLWAVQLDTTLGWYLPADSVFGAADFFDFGPFFKRGGYLDALFTWTVDAGSGSDDHLVAVSSNGEAVVFAGTDVSSPTEWRLIGVYVVGKPVRGRRFGVNVGGDLLLVTQTGLVSMAMQVTSTKVNTESSKVLSQKVSFLLSELAQTLGSLDGWQVDYFPAINLLFINIPSVYAGGAGQLVINMINQAWCTFSNMNAACWLRLGIMPYFGSTDGKVWRAWYGNTDGADTDGENGNNILSFVRQAYSYFGAQGVQKQVGMYRPVFLTLGVVGYDAVIDYDFRQSSLAYPSSGVPGATESLWDLGLWNTAVWSGEAVTLREWNQANGIGVAASIAMRLSTANETTWVSTDYTIRTGGPL